MDVVSSVRVSVMPGPGEVPRISVAPAPDAVRTELPARSTVQQSAAPQKPEDGQRKPGPGSTPELFALFCRKV